MAEEPVIALVPLAALHPAPWNPRTIRDERFKNLCDSILADPAFIWRRPILAQLDGTIYAGNMRYRAAEHLGMTEVPAIIEDVPDVLAKERALRDNAQWGDWQDDELARLLAELQDAESNLDLLGIEEADLKKLLAGPKVELTDPDAVPPTPDEPTTRPGDLWLLGEHRLLCGDATNKEDVERLCGGDRPVLTITDPPYGVNYEPNWRNEAAAKGLISPAARRVGDIANDDRTDWSEAWLLLPSDVIYCWSPAGSNSIESGNALRLAGYEIRNMIIWVKQTHVISRGHYHWRHEPCWYAVRKGSTAHWIGGRKQFTVWEAPMPEEPSLDELIAVYQFVKEQLSDVWQETWDKNVEGGHSTQKPVAIMERPIRNHEGDVYDPFLGSGTTLIACERLGRRCYAMEIEPRYVDVAVRRWEEFTGQKAVLDAAAD